MHAVPLSDTLRPSTHPRVSSIAWLYPPSVSVDIVVAEDLLYLLRGLSACHGRENETR